MARISPDEFASRVDVWLSNIENHFRKFAPGIFRRWAGRAVDGYMRNARGEGRRSPDDTGPLRILSGDLVGALAAGGPNRPGVIERVSGDPLRVTLSKGIDLGVVPYGRIHEYGGRAGRNHAAVIPARPYIEPALKDETPEIARMATRGLRTSFRREVLRA